MFNPIVELIIPVFFHFFNNENHCFSCIFFPNQVSCKTNLLLLDQYQPLVDSLRLIAIILKRSLISFCNYLLDQLLFLNVITCSHIIFNWLIKTVLSINQNMVIFYCYFWNELCCVSCALCTHLNYI